MKQLYALILTTFVLSVASVRAQNVFNINDPDSVFTKTNQPPVPPYGQMHKWGHSKVLNWNTTPYKSYYFNGLQFRLKFPYSYQQGVNDGKTYPIFVWFHGEGESGNAWNNEQQLYWGGQLFMDSVLNGSMDAFLLYDQTSNGYQGPVVSQVTSILDSLAKYCKVDEARIWLNGLSSGGQSEFTFMGAAPKYVTIAPIISAARPDFYPTIPKYIHIPMWLFNGGTDNNPAPAEATALIDTIRALGGYIKQTFYPTLGHGVWTNAWADPGFFPFIKSGYQSNPLCYFQITNFCPGQTVSARLGLTAGFYAYQWMYNGTVISGATSNEIVVNQLGTYSARFQRTSTSSWSDWSHAPVTLTSGATSSTPNIAIAGLRSDILPAPDGSKTVPLVEPLGYVSYKWVHLPDSVIYGTKDTLLAGPGTYVAQVTAQNACSSSYSSQFVVASTSGPNPPDPVTGLTVTSLSQTTLQLNWSQNPHPNVNETGTEIYRSLTSGGPYTLVFINPQDSASYVDKGLNTNTTYYYIVRAIDATAAAKVTNEASAKTLVDNIPPTAPTSLAVSGSSSSSVSLTWTAATDNVGVAYYDIYVNGKKAYTTPAPNVSYTVDNLLHDSTYAFQVTARDAAGNVSPFSNEVTGSAVYAGLTYNYYTTATAWSVLPNFNNLTPVSSGFTNNVSLSPATQTTNFGFIWQGYLNIRVAGTYTLSTTSDDGSDMWLGALGSTTSPYLPGGKPLVNNDGAHGSQTKSASIALKVGLYPIAITYFQAGGGYSMAVGWQCSTCGIKSTPIPDSAFKESITLPGGAPAAPSNLGASSISYYMIGLTWNDNSNNETGFEVWRATASAGPFATIGTTGPNVVAYTDSTASASTTYYYKVRALGQYGQSAFTTTANAKTAALPPAPKAPYGVKATVLGSSSISIVWKDSTNDAVNFQIYRASGSNSGYRLIKTITNPGGSSYSYTDSSLFDNLLYYYQVNATGPGGTSPFSNYDSGYTLLNNPVFNPIIKSFSMRYTTIDSVSVNATDKDGSSLALSAINLPGFGTFTDKGNGVGSLVLSPAAKDSGSYTIILQALAANSGVVTDTFTVAVNSFYTPVLSPISNASFNEGTTDTIALSATDQNPAPNLVFSSSNLPSFGTIVNNGNGSGSLVLTPNYISSGTFPITITVTDAQGSQASQNFTLTIIQKNPNKTYLIRAQYQLAVSAPWNNMTGPSISNLGATDGSQSTIAFNLSPSTWWNTYNAGPTTGNNSGVYSDSVLREYYYFAIFGGPTTVNDTISGLKPGAKYNLKFYGGSSWTGVPNNGTTVYTIGAQSDSLNVQNNTSQTANFYSVVADVNGRIGGSISVTSGTPVGYLNAMEIDFVYDDSTAPAKPTNLAATLVSKGVQLTWTDVAYNAQAYYVYRATDTTQPFSLLDTGANNSTATSFVDSTVSGHTTYYYKLKAINNYGNLGFTNTVSITTAARNPTVSAIGNTTAKINSTVNVGFTVTDDPGDAVTVTDSLPSFASLQNLGGGNYNIAISPTTNNIGTYGGSITATDSYGAQTSVPFQIFVVESNVKSVFVHFGTDTSVAGAPWNNFLTYPFAGSAMSNLTAADGTNSNMTVTLVDAWSNPPVDFGMITGDNSGIFPDIVQRSSLFETSNNSRRVQVSGLDTSKMYNIVVFSSVNSGQTSSGTFALGTSSLDFNPDYNASKTMEFNGLKTSTGSITFTYTKDPKSTYGYFNALVIQQYDSSVDHLVSPNFVFAQPLWNSKTSLNLYWADRSYNETGFQIWRATNVNGPFTQVATTASGATNYTDVGLTPNTQYFYEIRAVNATYQSDFSNVVSAITPAYIVLEHFTATEPESIKPWNNTGKVAQVGDVYTSLLNDQLNPSGLSLSILFTFGGEFDGGMNSGHNSFVFPDTVMQSMFWVQNASQTAVLQLSGLDQSKVYRIGFEGSSTWNLDQTAAMTINGVTKYLNADSNTTEVVYFNNLVPDNNGNLFLTFAAKGQYGLLGSLVIMSYTPSGVTGVPTNGLDTALNQALNGTATDETAVVADEIQNFRAFPNPFRDGFSIAFDNVGTGKKVDVEVYTLDGRRIYVQDGGYSITGTNTLSINLPLSTPMGMYIARLKTDGSPVKVFKVVKIR